MKIKIVWDMMQCDWQQFTDISEQLAATIFKNGGSKFLQNNDSYQSTWIHSPENFNPNAHIYISC